MNESKFKHKYDIGDMVYHISSEKKGYVVDIKYYYGSNSLEYTISFSIDLDRVCLEHELKDSPNFG